MLPKLPVCAPTTENSSALPVGPKPRKAPDTVAVSSVISVVSGISKVRSDFPKCSATSALLAIILSSIALAVFSVK